MTLLLVLIILLIVVAVILCTIIAGLPIIIVGLAIIGDAYLCYTIIKLIVKGTKKDD
jgi:threonine/homoserine/homoserine lactone efflux protein